MKSVNASFEDREMKAIKEGKGDRTWRKFIMEGARLIAEDRARSEESKEERDRNCGYREDSV